MSELILHVAERAQWLAAAGAGGEYRPATFASEGFIHCCRARQLAGVLARHFAGQRELVLLVVEAARLDAPLRDEDLYGAGESFPHLYGALPVAAVSTSAPIPDDPAERRTFSADIAAGPTGTRLNSP